MSCRRGVPDRCSYLNSLAEKVRELWERCANVIKSINGINPDGANNFDILPGAGIQVNPRANGIEIVATGAAPQGMIETINDIGPDENANFSISAGSGIQINEGENGIEIENISQGAIYTGISPIVVNADNEISIKDFVKYEDTDWSIFVNDGILTEDILIRAHFQDSEKGTFDKTFYHRKGENVSQCTDILGIISHNVTYPAIYYQMTGSVYFSVINALTNTTRFYSTYTYTTSTTFDSSSANHYIYENVRLGPDGGSSYLYKNSTGNYFAEIYRRV